MTKTILFPSFIVLLFLSAGAQSYFPLPGIKDQQQFNNGIARTMNLLKSSTSKNPNEVRIMVYGQSISQQDWWKEVKRYLDSSYPTANILFINKAIGGFSAERLIHTVENDIVSFYPDLILFHDYGSEEIYEKIIQVIRSRTSSEIALQTDHLAFQNQDWHDNHSDVWLPMIAKKYDLGLIDIRSAWKEYLQKNKLEIKDLLTDGVHLNEHGNYLMASVIKLYFKNFVQSPQSKSNVSVLKTGTEFQIRNGIAELPVYGNRIDLIWRKNTDTFHTVQIMVDGKKPSSLNECFYYTRPAIDTTGFFLRRIGQPLAIILNDQPVEEEWKMTITWSDSLKQELGFRIEGSVSGEDGAGRSDSLFTSRSGKVQILPAAWFRAREFAGFPWLKAGDVLKWSVKRSCSDEVISSRSGATTVLQGLKNRMHHIKLSGEGLSKLHGIRVYRPPFDSSKALHKKEY